MGDKTGISWTDATWNPVRGCSRVSAGCTRCYAERVAARFSDPGMPYHGLARRKLTIVNNEERDPGNKSEARWTGEVRLIQEHLADPLRWKKPRRIFVNSMSDLFHEKLTNEQIENVFAIMALAPRHTFQILTKRAKRMREWMARPNVHGNVIGRAWEMLGRASSGVPRRYVHEGITTRPWPLPNVWLGVSVENQEAAEDRIPELLRTPAVVRFLSCEPLIGEVDLDLPRCDDPNHGPSEWCIADDGATPYCVECDAERSYGHWLHLDGGIDWAIIGCESGHGSRPCDVEWIRAIRDQCAEAGVPIFLKQAEWSPPITIGEGSKSKGRGHTTTILELPYLDGVQHAAFPEVST